MKKSLLDELDEVIPTKVGYQFTKEMDEILVVGWEQKRHAPFIKWFNARYGFGGKDLLLARYCDLKDGSVKPGDPR